MYFTENFNFAAYLLTQDFKLEKTTRGENMKQITFVFSDPDNKINKLYRDFINGDLMVEVTAFIDAQKKVKNLIYA